jgi:MFS family permease
VTASSARAAAAAPRFAALHVPDYRRYFAWSLIAMTADNIEHVISYWVIFQVFHSPALAGFAVISHWVPFLLFSVYAGALADRHDCRKLIQVGQILFMVASLSWGLLFLTGALRMWHAVVILLIHGAAGVTGAPATQLIIHDMVGGADLQSAIRLNATARYLAILLGPAVGGGLMLLLGPAWGLLTNVGIYLPFSLFLWRIPYTGHLRDAGHARAMPRPRFRDMLRVLGEVRGDRRITVMILLGGITSFFVGNAFQAQMPEFAHHLGTDEAGGWYSLLLAANAAGAVLGTVLLESTNLLRPSPRAAIACAGIWALAIGLFPAAPGYTSALALLVVAGIFNLAFSSMAQTLVQLLAPARVRGRVVGLFNTAALGLRAGSGLTVGVLGALIGVQRSLMLSSAVVVASSLVLLTWQLGPTTGPVDTEPATSRDVAPSSDGGSDATREAARVRPVR